MTKFSFLRESVESASPQFITTGWPGLALEQKREFMCPLGFALLLLKTLQLHF